MSEWSSADLCIILRYKSYLHDDWKHKNTNPEIYVGNTTTQRPDPFPEGYTLPQREAIALLEQGGYSGPQLFSRTVKLVGRYRRLLDEGLDQGRRSSLPPGKQEPPEPGPETPAANASSDISSQIDATKARDMANLKLSTPNTESDSTSQPLIRFPERHKISSSNSPNTTESPALSSSSHINQLPNPSPTPSSSSSRMSSSSPPPLPQPPKRKVIFATGGITTGAQALEVLESGASVCQVYTALVYGGAGTITRMKGEMREEIKRRRR